MNWRIGNYFLRQDLVNRTVRVAPSLLAADFGSLGAEAKRAEEAGADLIHVDVMDGHFVPNITVGANTVSALKRWTSLPLDVHLMVSDPERLILDFVKAGANLITVHAEATAHLHRAIQLIKQEGCAAGVAINPATSCHVLEYVLDDVDLILVMTVNPGFGGQEFIRSTLPKVSWLRSKLDSGRNFEIEVDGGINCKTIKLAYDAGATVFVAGSAVFGETDMRSAISRLREACTGTCI